MSQHKSGRAEYLLVRRGIHLLGQCCGNADLPRNGAIHCVGFLDSLGNHHALHVSGGNCLDNRCRNWDADSLCGCGHLLLYISYCFCNDLGTGSDSCISCNSYNLLRGHGHSDLKVPHHIMARGHWAALQWVRSTNRASLGRL